MTEVDRQLQTDRVLPWSECAAAGGWKGTVALQRSYLHADEQTMLNVVLSGAELRDVRKA
jgi:hypothetical protein